MAREQERHRRRALIATHFSVVPLRNIGDFEKKLSSLPPTLVPTLVLDLEEMVSSHHNLELFKYYNQCFKNLNLKILMQCLKRNGYG